ncbi:MAG: ABC transporter permease [Clostridia bacterium]|nr:ABC transporter permease [Clostridia bacterium]MBR2053302.1 ABC transporter permease [Clostridia bacterium]MBR6754120.1 ABC transporter permease [Clostridia bacterium]
MNSWLNFAISSLGFGAIFMYGATGEILTEKAGHLNLGIPGIMCMGGAGGCLALCLVAPLNLPGFLIVLAGIFGAVLFGMLTGLIYSFLTITLRANQNVTGLALTTFGAGLSRVLFGIKAMNHTTYLKFSRELFRQPFANRTDELQKLGILFFLALVICCVASWVLMRTKVGLRLRSIGENPGTADAVGVNVTKYKYIATLIGAGIAALGGFYSIIDFEASNEAYKNLEEYGWLSVALVIFSLWRPHLAIIGSIAFGFLYRCASQLTTLGGIFSAMTAQPLMKMLPYVVTIIVLIISSISKKRENQPPASLGMPYFREER